jgi:Helix-turn-helix of DDE superfamily endonuclease
VPAVRSRTAGHQARWWWPTYARTRRDLRRAASGFQIDTSTVHRYVREAIKLLAAMAPTLAQSIEVARGKAPAARQDPTTPFNLMGHIFLNVHERNRDIS